MKAKFSFTQIALLIAAAFAFVVVAQLIHVRVKGSASPDFFDLAIWGVAMYLGALLPIRKYVAWRDEQQAAKEEPQHEA